MKKKTPEERSSQTANALNRCIWMTAGVISFKLCPLDYDCEHCDFDEAMRSEVKLKRERVRPRQEVSGTKAEPADISASKTEQNNALFFTFSAGEANERLHLHPAHLWVRQSQNGKWRLGIGRLLAYVLPPIKKADLHSENTKIVQNGLLGKLHTEVGIVPLTAPLSGVVTRTNFKLFQQPELMQLDPEGKGWLLEIDWAGNRLELEHLYVGLSGKRYLEEEAQHLNYLLRHRGVQVENIGTTLGDGGEDIKHLHQILPNRVCLGLAGELLVSGKHAW
jgi:glycine cleavage system H protein